MVVSHAICIFNGWKHQLSACESNAVEPPTVALSHTRVATKFDYEMIVHDNPATLNFVIQKFQDASKEHLAYSMSLLGTGPALLHGSPPALTENPGKLLRGFIMGLRDTNKGL